jgi:hypothetical protein
VNTALNRNAGKRRRDARIVTLRAAAGYRPLRREAGRIGNGQSTADRVFVEHAAEEAKLQVGRGGRDEGKPVRAMRNWRRCLRFGFLPAALVCFGMFQPAALRAEQVRVRYLEGEESGFLALRSLDGRLLADGEISQVAAGDHVTLHLVFRFKDGSLYDDTTAFSQRGYFRLLSDHVIECGPSFKPPMETWINASTGQVRVRYDDQGKEKTVSDPLHPEPDVANGLLFTLLKDIRPAAPQTTLSYVAFTPKPRMVKLVITPEGEVPISDGTIRLKAMRYRIKIKIGGLTGIIASLAGKRPPDMHMWVLEGMAPAVVKFQGSLYPGGPQWQVGLSVPRKLP